MIGDSFSPAYNELDMNILAALGLSSRQAKIYLTILCTGSVPVGQISKIVKIHREDIYRAVPKLEELGLVETLLGKPIQIRPLPIEKALYRLIQRAQDSVDASMANLKHNASEFLSRHRENGTQPHLSKTADFILLKDRTQILTKMGEMLNSAEKEVDAIFSVGEATNFLSVFEDSFHETGKKAVQARLLTRRTAWKHQTWEPLKRHLQAFSNLEFRVTDDIQGHCIIIDKREALSETAFSEKIGENPSLWTDSESLVALMKLSFENIWEKATTITSNPYPSYSRKRVIAQV